MTDKSRTEQLFDKLKQGEPITLDQPFNFSCRGCGFNCCQDMTIMLTPPEYAVILWHLARNPIGKMLEEGNIQWADLSIGETTGLPIAGINFQPAGDEGPRYCPFLLPVAVKTANGFRRLHQAWCGLRDARPGACRIFPLGRLLDVEAHADFADSSKWAYFITTRCPGFEPAQAGEDVPPGYIPPNGTLLRD